MGKRRKRKGKRPLEGWKPLTSIRQARRVTSAFHKLTAAIDETTSDSQKSQGRHGQKAKLERALAEIGGREAYQNASILLTGINKRSAKWTFQSLTQLGMRPRKGEAPINVLEVGAVNTQLLSCPWLNVRAIDLASRHPKIEQADFFVIKPKASYSCVVNAMVINCVPTPQQRGRMLRLCNAHLRLNGLLVLVLPRRCVEASSQLTVPKLFDILATVGFRVERHEQSPKILYISAVKTQHVSSSAEAHIQRREQRKRSNSDSFAIEL